MSFSYDRAWQDFMTMLRANAAMLLVLAGVFMFFPTFVLSVYLPVPEPDSDSGLAGLNMLVAYFRANSGWFVLVNAIANFAQTAILLLLLDRARPTVGESLGVAAGLFPAFFIAQIVTNMAVGAGFVLLLVPGIYLLGRFAVVGPLLVDRRMGNPFKAIAKGWRATAGHGWRIAGLILLVVIVGWIALSAATSVLTVLASLIAPETLRPIIAALASAVSSAVLGLVSVVLTAAIYRQLASPAAGGTAVS